MKKIIPVILILLLLLSACGKDEPIQTTPTGTEGIPTGSETVNGGEGEGILDPTTEIRYLIVKMIVTNDAGQELSGTEYTYDDTGFCVSQRQYSNIGGAGYTCLNTPGANGLVARSDYTEPDGTAYTVEYTYNDDDLLVKETVLRENATEITEYTYDEQGNYLTLRQSIGGELVMDYTFSYTYDGQGNRVAMDEYLFGDLMYHVTFTYDGEGREISSVTSLLNGEIQSRTVSQWDGLTETRLYYSGEDEEPFMVSVFTYDDSGNVVFEETRQDDTVINRAEYIYEPFEVKK